MIAGDVLALPGIALLAAGTPRQAHLLSRRAFGHPGRKRMRAAGLVLLALSLALSLTGSDAARHAVEWVTAIGVEAMAVAMAFTLLAAFRSARSARSSSTDRS